MTNAELIKALRECKDHELCTDCKMLPNGILSDFCNIKEIAADALEAADEKIADCTAAIEALDDSNDAYIKENERLKKRIAELEAQLPKEGEWLDEQRGRWIYAKCNLCGKVQDVRSNYCPNCGAKMDGERKDGEHDTVSE